MSRDFLPRQDVRIADEADRTTTPFYVWFQGLERLLGEAGVDITGLQQQIDALRAEVEELAGGKVFLHSLGSVLIDGTYPNYYLRLDGDTLSPGNTYYYGTGPDGTKGWHTVASALVQGAGITLTVNVDGTIDIAHADTSSVTDISASFTGGTVPEQISLTFDEFGHVLTRTITGRTLDHNDTGALQGGNSTERYHFTEAEHTGLLPWASQTPSAYVPTSRTLTAGTGLDGGGDLSADRTFDLDAATLASLAEADSSVQSVTGAGVDNTDPRNPVITGGSGTVDTITAADSTVVVDSTDPANPTVRFTHLPTNTIVGRNDAGTGMAEALTPSEVRTMIGPVSASGLNHWNIGGTSGSMAFLSAADTWSLVATTSYGRSLLNAADLGGVTGTSVINTVLAGSGIGIAPSFQQITTSAISDVESGTYTPTITNVTNVAASTSNGAQYMRVGNTVTVSGSVDIDPTATGTTTIRISLPIASTFGANRDCAGVMSSTNAEVGPILASVANNNAQCQFAASNTANHAFYFHFTYRII